MLLAIDTSTRYAGVALLDEQSRLLHLLHWRSRQNHSVEVLPAIDMLLKREQATVKDLDGIAITIGPGSFSALRVGLSTAMGLAWAEDIPLITATTLEAEAFAHRFGGAPVCAVLDVGRNQLAWALFEERDGQLHLTSQEKISDPLEMVIGLPSPTLICGEALEKFGDVLSNSAPEGVKLALPYLPSQRVVSLAYLGMTRLHARFAQAPASIEPLYMRRPTITQSRPRPSKSPSDG